MLRKVVVLYVVFTVSSVCLFVCLCSRFLKASCLGSNGGTIERQRKVASIGLGLVC